MFRDYYRFTILVTVGNKLPLFEFSFAATKWKKPLERIRIILKIVA